MVAAGEDLKVSKIDGRKTVNDWVLEVGGTPDDWEDSGVLVVQLSGQASVRVL